MLVAQQNEKGGLLGCDLEAIVVDPASDWSLFAERARELLSVTEVDVIFDSWTSVSRKAVLPVLEELNGLTFYPVQYEGEQSSRNVFCTGAAPNQQELAAANVSADDIPVVAVSVGEEELSNLVGRLAAWNYFMSADTPENAAFIEAWHAFMGNTDRVTNDPMEAPYIGFTM